MPTDASLLYSSNMLEPLDDPPLPEVNSLQTAKILQKISTAYRMIECRQG